MIRTYARALTAVSSVIVVSLFLVITPPVSGSTFTVINTADSGAGSLRDAIGGAADGDTITFSLDLPATITIQSPLIFGPNVTITGPGASSLAISGGNSVGVLVINAGAVETISGVTIELGSSLLGGGIFNAGTLTLTDSTVANNGNGQLGAGIFNSGTATLTNCTVTLNGEGGPEPSGGAGIENFQGTLTLNNSTVSKNNASGTGSYRGGGILNDGGLTTLNNSTVSGNAVSSTAGGDAMGGGIANIDSGSLIVSNSTIAGNFSEQVGTNTGTNAGGAGIWNGFPQGHGSLKLTDSTVSGNLSQGSSGGGGIKNEGVLTMLNSTVAANGSGQAGASGGSGGGIQNSGTADVSNSTVSGNTTNPDTPPGISGGGIDNSVGALTVKNSILAGNIGGNCGSSFSAATNLSMGHNLSDDASCTTFFNETGDLNNTPSGLDPGGLKNNGGPAQTIALEAGTAGVNAIPLVPANFCTDTNGIPVTTDERGTPRPQSIRCDMGAFELFSSRLPVQAVEVYEIVDSVQQLPVPPARQLVLTVPLEAAVIFLNAGVTNPAIVSLDAFNVLTKAMQQGGGLTTQQAMPLIGSAQRIVLELSSPSHQIP